MKTVTVRKSDLLAHLEANRASHRTIFEQAQDIYRKQVVAELDRMLDDARSGRDIRRAILLPEPEDHTEDYDQAILMLDMSVDEEIQLTYEEFRQFVMDQWGWQRSFASNTTAYLAT